MTSIAVLFTNYGPYHLARLESFNKVCNKELWELTCIELARVEALYPWRIHLEESNLRFHTLFEDSSLESTDLFLMILRLFRLLNKLKPDIIAVAGYAHPAMFSALLWSTLNRKKTILFSATKEDDSSRNAATEILKSHVLKLYNGALVGGQPQKRYLVKLGMPSENIELGYNVVGNSSFHPAFIKKLPSPLKRPYLLSVNRFVPKKNLFTLLEAYKLYHSFCSGNTCDLVLCGDGPLRDRIEEYIISNNLDNKVHLPGFLQQEDLKPYYAHARYFIHASLQEQWGLVVNEAMAAGLPIIISNKCGCYEDLIIEGKNGFGFSPDSVQELSDLMRKMDSDEVNLSEMGIASLNHIQNFSPEYFASSLKSAIQKL